MQTNEGDVLNYFLTEEQNMIKGLAAKIAREKIAPQAPQLDETEEFPREILNTLAEADLLGLYLPKEYGGFGGGCLELCLAIEEISWACVGVSTSFAANALGAFPILLFGTPEQKKKHLPDIATGKKLVAFALTESEAGSDAGAIRTLAQKIGNEYIINGSKQWITNGGEADIYTVIALTDKSKGSRGASAFIVEKGISGFSFGKKEKKLGIRCSTTQELIFENCKIPQENLIGKEGMGFIVAMKTLDYARPGIGAQAIGLAQRALDESLQFARERVQFGKPISSFQAIQHMLADMATNIEASRALVYSTARYIDSGAKDISKASAMAKLFATDCAMKIAIDAIQIFGGHGYMREYPVEKLMRDAKILQIYEGTNQIQRNIIALQLIKESASKKRQARELSLV